MGALVAYCVVSICVVILRYRESDKIGNKQEHGQECCLASIEVQESVSCSSDRSIRRLVNSCVAIAG